MSSPPRPLARRHRVAVVGAGAMGRRHTRVLSQLAQRFEVVGVLDLDARAALAACEEWQVPRLITEQEALGQADAIVVATPIAAHAETVERALAAGRHVLVEKPIAATVSDARALLALADRAGRQLFVGHSERFNPVVRALAARVDPGDVLAVELRRVGAPSSPSRAADGALLNLGVHDLDLAAYLTQSPLSLRHAVGDADTAHVLVRTASGAAGHVHVDQRALRRQRTLALTTRTHIYQGDLMVPSLTVTCRVTGRREFVTLGTEEPLVLQALAFADALDGDVSRTIARGIDGARALLAAERAAERIERRAVTAPPSVRTLAVAARGAVAAEKL